MVDETVTHLGFKILYLLEDMVGEESKDSDSTYWFQFK